METEEDTHLPTRKPSPTHQLLRERFDEDIVRQATLMDDMAKLLITVNLTVMGLYATALKLISGDAATTISPSIGFAFICWLFALMVALAALMPRYYRVDRDTIRRSPPHEFDSPLSIEAYFKTAARHKYHRVVASCCCFIIGVVMALISLL